MIGWLVKKMFDRTVKSAENFMQNDPRVRTAVISAAAAMQKSEDDSMKEINSRFGGTPDEIADRARSAGMSVEKYMFYFLRKYPDGSRRRLENSATNEDLDLASKVKVLEPGQNPGEFKFIKRITIWSVPFGLNHPLVTREDALDRAKKDCVKRMGDTLMNLTFDERTDTKGNKIISLSADIIKVSG